MRWLQSGLRRDICVVVAGLDSPTGQQTKAALERRYDDRIQPKTFHGALESLVDREYLSRTQEGLADHYALTEAGAQSLQSQVEWMSENLDARSDSDGVEQRSN